MYAKSVLIGLYASIFVVVPILSNKILLIGDMQLLAGIPFMTLAYMFVDLLNERWGKRAARGAVASAAVARLFMYVVAIPIVLNMPGLEMVDCYSILLKQSLVFFLAAEVAMVIPQLFLDIPLFDWMKRNGKVKDFWVRYNLTTHISSILSAWFIITIAYVFVYKEQATLLNMLATGAAARVAITFCLTPIATLIAYGMRRIDV